MELFEILPLQDESEDGAVVLTAQDVVLFRGVLRPNVLLVQVTLRTGEN